MRVGFIRTSTPCQPLRNFSGNTPEKCCGDSCHTARDKQYELACRLLAAQNQRIAELEAKYCPRR